MVPVVYNELSLNYCFVLLPFASIFVHSRLRRPPKMFIGAFTVFTFVYLVSFLGQFDLYPFALRRTVSFLIFMTYFSYVLLQIDQDMLRAFKLAVVGIGLLYAIGSAMMFFSLGGSALSFSAKDLVGDQRIGFVYILGCSLVYFARARDLLRLVGKWVLLAVLMGGLLLTFSRGAIVGLLGSVFLYCVVSNYRWLLRPTPRGLRAVGLALITLFGALILLRIFLPTTFDFFAERLFKLDKVQEEVSNPEASAGVRMELTKLVASYVSQHPLTGSGYLGLWVLPERPADANSTHNQYADILLRTGVVGFAMFVFLLYHLMRFLYAREKAFFWGVLAVLFMSFFHDIFKESGGAFVLAFGFGLLSQALREKRSRRAVMAPNTG